MCWPKKKNGNSKSVNVISLSYTYIKHFLELFFFNIFYFPFFLPSISSLSGTLSSVFSLSLSAMRTWTEQGERKRHAAMDFAEVRIDVYNQSLGGNRTQPSGVESRVPRTAGSSLQSIASRFTNMIAAHLYSQFFFKNYFWIILFDFIHRWFLLSTKAFVV